MKHKPRQPVFALIDCNNFFVSCERVFRPDLWDKPVAVLSNNDGCVIARSNEVKAMGVPMGAPYFKYRDVIDGKVTVFSANFPLYGDLSQRVVEIIQESAPDMEVYSVDESFVELTGMAIKDHQRWAEGLRQRILQWTGLPVSIGVAHTKTLAKAAADHAKKHADGEGVYVVLDDPVRHEALIGSLPLTDIWGVGHRTGSKLRELGFATAYDLTLAPDAWIRKTLTVRGLRTVMELRGQAAIGIEVETEPQKSISRTRSFGHSIRNYHELESAVATFAAVAAGRLRRNSRIAGAVVGFIRTSRHAAVQRSISSVTTLEQPTADTAVIIQAALWNLQTMYDPDFAYQKAGVVLVDLRDKHQQQLSLLGGRSDELERREGLMRAVDSINARYGLRMVTHATEGLSAHRWHSKREKRSPAYTSSWHELPVVTSK